MIVEHDSVGYLDPDVRAVLDDFAENARSAASALISGRWPAADLNGRLVRPLRDPSDCQAHGNTMLYTFWVITPTPRK